MRVRAIACLLALASAAAPAAAGERVVLVRGTCSAPNAAERGYAAAVARYLDRWLTEIGVPHDVADDEDLQRGAPAGARALILGYNPFPDSRMLAALRRFADGGGSLIVCFGGDPKLAALLGVQLGAYRTAGRDDGWSAMRFVDGAPPHVPERVLQRSRNVRLAAPAPGSATRVIARWEDRGGRLLPDPAWLQSERGFWMTHVLLDDGDAWGKKQLLLALLGACDPSVWKPALAISLRHAETLGTYDSFADAADRLARLARAANAAGALQDLAEAHRVHGRILSLGAAGREAEALPLCRELETLLVRAYAAAQAPRAGEFRGVWEHSGLGLYPGDWDRTCRRLAELGIRDLFVNVLSPVRAHYAGSVVPASPQSATYGDQMEQCLAAAHRAGLRVHAWKVCWKVEGATAEELAQLRREGRLQLSDGRETLPWLCPSNPENVRREKDAVRHLLKTYAVDGLHLDYIRFPSSHACFCDACRRAFEAQAGQAASSWPPPAKSRERQAFLRWRREPITRFVRDVRAMARQAAPRAQVSAAVYGTYLSCVESIGQDWPGWLKSGDMDFVCPMDYTTNLTQFARWVELQMMLPDAERKIIPGIGVTATESTLGPVQVIDQIREVRRAGAPGFVLFDLNSTLEHETLPALRLGITREAAAAARD